VFVLSPVAVVLLAALVLTFLYSALAPKLSLAFYTVVAFTVPLLLLWLYLARHPNWWFFGSGSILPHVLAALVFIAALVATLVRVSGALSAKLLVGMLTTALWGVVWFNLTLLVGCVTHACF